MKLKIQIFVLSLFFIGQFQKSMACKADFNIYRVSSNSFYVTDSSVCNRSQTSYNLTVTNLNQQSAIGFGYNITLQYNGTARILLRIYDSTTACFDSISKTFVVSGNDNCDADFYIYSFSNLTMNFALKNFNPATVRYKMDFGDGTFAYNMNTSHTYGSCGTYTATLYARDSTQSALDTFVYTFKIGINTKFDVYKSGNNGYYLNNSSFYTSPILPIYSDSVDVKCFWDFGDGDTSISNYNYHVYKHPGTYTVKLVMTYLNSINVCSHKDSITKTLTVGCSIAPSFTYSVSGKTYSYTNTTTGANLRYIWRFGDTTTSTQKNPTHTYSTYKNYLTQLVAIDTIYGCRDSITSYSKFCNIKTNLQLVYDSAHPYQATLYNYSSGPINKHYWDFGDGTKSTSAAPVHNYSTIGYISLKYIGTDSTTGCADTAIINFTIDNSGNIKRKAFVFTVVDKTNTASVSNVESIKSIRLFPNPFKNQITLAINGDDKIDEIAVFNAMGQEVYNHVTLENNKEYVIQTGEQLASGIYFIKVTRAQTVTYLKVIKE